MTATAAIQAAWEPVGAQSALPPQLLYFLVASGQVGRGQFCTVSPSTGYASLNDGATPNQIPAGVAYPEFISGTSSVAGAAASAFWQGFGGGEPGSTNASDGFTVADVCTPFYIADENTPGALSNYGGNNRSLGGLVLGVMPGTTTKPLTWCGPVPWAIARSVAALNVADGGDYQVNDAAASTAITERAMNRRKLHGSTVAVQYVGSALVVGDTDYVTISIAKRDGAGGSPVVVATYDSRAAGNGAATAFVPKAFTLSVVAGATDLLETDVLTITTVKGGSGQSLSGTIRLIQKVG